MSSKYGLSLETMFFFEYYRKNYIEERLFEVGDRSFLTINFKYDRFHTLGSKLSLIYGAGTAYRAGYETVIMNSGGIYFKETNVINCARNDIGLNGYFGYEYNILKWMSIFSKVDFLGFVYMNNTEVKEELVNIYHINGFPSRFDLSLKLGIGFNF